MTNNVRNAVTTGLTVLGAGLFISWLSGYNFDHRGLDVAINGGIIIGMALSTVFLVVADGG